MAAVDSAQPAAERWRPRLRMPTATLERWDVIHAASLLISALSVAGGVGPGWLALVAGASLVARIALSWRTWTASGRFGWANSVTALRLVLTLTVLTWGSAWQGLLVGGLAALVLFLDVADGWIARRAATASAFGAAFDVEADAVFVLTLPVLLVERGDVSRWVLLAGLWRYLFVLLTTLLPAPAQESRRSRYGRSAYFALVASLVLALSLPQLGVWGERLCLLGTGVLSLSFLTSLVQCYCPPSPRRPG
jgi:phosphatidylglycerophosphate synthase